MTTAGKNKEKSLPSDNETDAKESDVFKYIVSEGSYVVLDLHDFISDENIESPNIRFETYRQIDGTPHVDLHKENDKVYGFTAPYVRGNQINKKLNFELVASDNSGNSNPYNVTVVVKRVHRAIIFQ